MLGVALNLRSLRQGRGLSQAGLAGLLDTTQQTIARWETGKSQVNIGQVRKLAAALACSVGDLLGPEDDKAPVDGAAPRLVAEQDGRVFGTLQIDFRALSRNYPISESVARTLQRQMREPRSEPGLSAWIIGATLNNRYLFINRSHLAALTILGTDIEPAERFERPEVYRALGNWADHKPQGPVRDICDRLIARDGDKLLRGESRLHILHDDAQERWLTLTSSVVRELIALEASAQPATFAALGEGRDQTRFVSLEQVALIEAPIQMVQQMRSISAAQR